MVLLEAPGGYGKSTLAVEIAAALDRPTVRVAAVPSTSVPELVALLAQGLGRAGMAQLAGVLGAGDSVISSLETLEAAGRVTVVVDDVHRLDPAAAAWLADVIEGISAETRVVVCGRRLGGALAALTRLDDATHLTTGDLRFSEDEVAQVLTEVVERPPTPVETASVSARTEGWPAAVALAATRLGRGRAIEVGGPPAGILERLLEAELARTDPETRATVADLAQVPLLSAEVAAAIGGDGALDRLLDLGLPVRFRIDGWGELPGSVRELLSGSRPLATNAARAVAGVYARCGEIGEAVTLLSRVGDHDGLVALLADRPRSELTTLGLRLLATVLRDVPDSSFSGHAEVLAHACLEADEHAPELRPEWIERADRLAGESGTVRRLVDAERSRELAREGRFGESLALATSVIDASLPNEELARGRAHLTRGITALVTANGTADERIIGDVEAAVALFKVAGETRCEALALQTLGVGVYQPLGAFDRVEESLAAAVALLSKPDRTRGLALTYLAEAATQRGNLEAAETAAREAMAIGVRLAATDVLGYAAWSRAALAAQRRDRRGVERALHEATANPGTWYARPAGIDFLADASAMRLLVGDIEGARRDLDLAEQRSAGTGYVLTALTARARFEATVGDASVALDALDELDRFGIARDRCLYELLRAVCAHRIGDAGAVESHLRAARYEAAVIDDPERLERREPELLAIVGDDDAAATVPACRVRLLGAFEVRRGGDDVTPPAGRPATLVKLLAMRGTLMIEEATEVLWGEADATTGRARLRNLLGRVRASCGPLVERREDALALVDGVEVDADAFDRAVTESLAAQPSERVGLARRALAGYSGRLLPGDLYADWAAAPRERLQRRYLSMVDLLAADALERGDIDDAVRLLDDAIEAEPMDLARYAIAASALLVQGRRAGASALVKRGLAVAEELGGVPVPDLEQLVDELAEGAP